MAPGATKVVGFCLIPVVGHFNCSAFIFTLVTDECIGKSPFGVFVLAQNKISLVSLAIAMLLSLTAPALAAAGTKN